jgi:hypothetical protein
MNASITSHNVIRVIINYLPEQNFIYSQSTYRLYQYVYSWNFWLWNMDYTSVLKTFNLVLIVITCVLKTFNSQSKDTVHVFTV